MSQPFAFRPGTNDEAMFRHLQEHAPEEYHLPERFEPRDIVMDIGVHIGGFSYLALSRGARRVYGYEAEPSNVECARLNLARFGDRFQIRNRAVWRSDVPGPRLTYAYSSDAANTGGGSMFFGVDEGRPLREVPSISLDDAIEEATEGGRRRVRLLKIDCEGSEFPILLTSEKLGRIDRIAGEFHELGCDRNPQEIPEAARVPGVARFTVEVLADALRLSGFEVSWTRQGDSALGLFHAVRPASGGLAGRLRSAFGALGRAIPGPHLGRGGSARPSTHTTTDERTPR